MQLWVLDELLLSSALAAAWWLSSDSLVGVLGHLLPDGDDARALLCLSAHVLCGVSSCRHTGQRQPAKIILSLQFQQHIDPPVDNMRATTARHRLHP